MDTIKHNPARLHNCDEIGITIVQHKHTKILGLKGKRQISSLEFRRTGISCDSRQLYESNWTLHSSVTCISNKIYETRNDEWHTAWVDPRVPSLWVDTERDFSQWFLHFIKHTKPTKEDPVILVQDGHYSHTRKLKGITLAREIRVHIICLQPHKRHKMSRLDKAFMWSIKHSSAKKLKNRSLHI